MRYLILIFIITSCDVFYPAVYDVPEDVEPYLRKFEEEGAKRGRYFVIDNIEVRMVTLPAAKLGTISTRHETIILEINKTKWPDYQDSEKEALVFHELGHKVLDRRHVPDDSLSLMQEAPNLKAYEGNRQYLLDELFK